MSIFDWFFKKEQPKQVFKIGEGMTATQTQKAKEVIAKKDVTYKPTKTLSQLINEQKPIQARTGLKETMFPSTVKENVAKSVAGKIQVGTQIQPITNRIVPKNDLITNVAKLLLPESQNDIMAREVSKGGTANEISRRVASASMENSLGFAMGSTNKLGGLKNIADDVIKKDIVKGVESKLVDNIKSPLNTKNFNIKEESKVFMDNEAKTLTDTFEKYTGQRMSNQEMKDLADKTSNILKTRIGEEQTLKYNAAMYNLRSTIAKEAETGVVDKDFINHLVTLKTQGTDIARKLQALGAKASPDEKPAMQKVLEAVLKTTDDTEAIMKAAKGVDFNDANQAADFYRKFIKPTSSEWLDLIRYNSMLSSPNTHIINAFSNFINSAFVAPVEKTLTGQIDFLGSKLFNKKQTHFAGEGLEYAKGYYQGMGNAVNKMTKVMSGKAETKNLDVRYIAPATKGVKGAIAKGLSFPMRMLEASDQFFTALAANGELATLKYKAGKGVKVTEAEEQAYLNASYRLFRQNLHTKEQGALLNTIDDLTGSILKLRNSKSTLTSTIARFSVPFVKTPMNILKQGIEYSPTGVLTLYGAKNKTEQIAKTVMGTAVAAVISSYAASGRLTFSNPANDKEALLWKQAGVQPYSIKIGDRWISYQKLPPVFSFPMAMIAGVKEMYDNKKIGDDEIEMILGSVAKYADFMKDQSYFQGISTLTDASSQGWKGINNVMSNYEQQLIPYKALSSWLARLTDDAERKVDNKASLIDQQIQKLMMNIPSLREKVPALTDSDGNVILQKNKELNAFSPFKIQQENAQLKAFLDNYKELNKETKKISDEKKQAQDDFEPKYLEIRKLVDDNKLDEAMNAVNELSEEDYEKYKSLKSQDKSSETRSTEVRVYPTYKQVQTLVAQGREDEAMGIIDSMTDEDYAAYQKIKTRLTP